MYIITPSAAQLAEAMKRHAETGTFKGKPSEGHLPYFSHARQLHFKTGTSLLFTRDIGHHSSGWFKNPDYERCYHLSLSFWDFTGEEPQPRAFEHGLAKAWVQCFYGDWARFVWEEGPSQKRLPNEVRHYRVFCDPAWKPIVPRGEVYTRDFIEKGWLSWSDLQHEKQKEREA